MLFDLGMDLAEWVSSALDAVGFEYSPEMVTVKDSSNSREGVNVSFREREREKPCLRV